MKIFDSIHGYIDIDPLAKKIIDTIEFQRLRDIKQLGLCYYVFPGASHNRFEHSIGVYYLSKKYMEILGREYFNDKQFKLISIAALIHDIGHGPFSHLFDELTNSNHEERSIDIFSKMNDKYDLSLSPDDLEFIHKVIYPTKECNHYLYQIVSNVNGIDVDRMDYIMRDIKMIGLNYGIEYQKIMKSSKIIDNNIKYSITAETSIDDYYRTRYILYKDIYNHKTVRSIEYMLKNALNKSNEMNHIIEIINKNLLDEFILITDNFIDKLYRDDNETKEFKSIINNIFTRNLYKFYGEIIIDYKLPNYSILPNIILDETVISYYSDILPEFYNNIRIQQHSNIIKYKIKKEYNYKFYHSISYDSLKEIETLYDKFIRDITPM